uniref:cartilage-associated protein-like n=1 Tax=Myxine glutinosa TaxID=7769 RepID=UPI00358EE4A7
MLDVFFTLLLLLPTFLSGVGAQYEQYDFLSFPRQDLQPIEATYRRGLNAYAAEDWRECVSSLELSLRQHRFLRDSQGFCRRNCSDVTPWHNEGELGVSLRQRSRVMPVDPETRYFGAFIHRADCLRRCREGLPAFRMPQPSARMLQDFQQRNPYQYLLVAYFKTNNMPKAVASAYTFIQKNPENNIARKNMHFFLKQPGVSESYIKDLESEEYEVLYHSAVHAYNKGEHEKCANEMERALRGYLAAFEECTLGCEGPREVHSMEDFYKSIADRYVEVLFCKTRCEKQLLPVSLDLPPHKFLATMYHYLQFVYHKLGNFQGSVRAIEDYLLFDPTDRIVRQNQLHHHTNREYEGLTESDFTPTMEASRHYNLTTLMWKMLTFAQNFLAPEDEMELPQTFEYMPEVMATDEDFDGEGDYEEGFVADWWQEPQYKGDLGIMDKYEY